MYKIRKAVKRQRPIICGVFGRPGDGKTLSALKLAVGAAGSPDNVLFLDMDAGRGEQYADYEGLSGYHYVELPHNISSNDLCHFLTEFVVKNDQFKAIVIDSGSHEYESMIDYADKEAARLGRQGLDIWKAPKAAHNRFRNLILNCGKHIFVTYQMSLKIEDAKAKQKNQDWAPVIDKKDQSYLEVIIDVSRDDNNSEHGIIKASQWFKAMYHFRDAIKAGDRVTIDLGQKLAGKASEGEKRDETANIDAARNALVTSAQVDGLEGMAATWKSFTPEIQKKLSAVKDKLKEQYSTPPEKHHDQENINGYDPVYAGENIERNYA